MQIFNEVGPSTISEEQKSSCDDALGAPCDPDTVLRRPEGKPRRIKLRTSRDNFRTVKRRFQMPSSDTISGHNRFTRSVLAECEQAMTLPLPGGGPAKVPPRFVAALTGRLSYVALPIDRFYTWMGFGEMPMMNGLVNDTLQMFGFRGQRLELTEAALMAIEAYPSKKPIDSYYVLKVIEEVGRITS